MNKVFLALDFDGVLNNDNWIFCLNGRIPDHDDDFDHIDPSRVAIMDKLVDILDCKIVISSAWRILHNLADIRFGLTSKGANFRHRIIGKTDSKGPIRGAEIARWMQKYDDHALVIIDDSTDMGHLIPYLVRTSSEYGIVESDIDRAISIVNAQTRATSGTFKKDWTNGVL